MCGRFSLSLDPDEIAAALPGYELPADLAPRYNIAPSQSVAVIANTGAQKVELFRWGLIPAWAKDPAIGDRMINARAETLTEKPAFRAAFRRRRCLILADGFYEWRAEPGSRAKTPYYIRLMAGGLFAFAGLWETWQPPTGEPLHSCTILTTTPNALIAPIHDRMPVILPEAVYPLWLAPGDQSPAALQPLLAPYPAEALVAHPVSRLVNAPRHDAPDCIVPA